MGTKTHFVALRKEIVGNPVRRLQHSIWGLMFSCRVPAKSTFNNDQLDKQQKKFSKKIHTEQLFLPESDLSSSNRF